MSAADKIQAPIRLYKKDYDKIRKVASREGVSFQKVAEVLLLKFAKEEKALMNIIKKYAEEHKLKKGRKFDETEKSSIYDQIENLSPIKNLEERQ